MKQKKLTVSSSFIFEKMLKVLEIYRKYSTIIIYM